MTKVIQVLYFTKCILLLRFELDVNVMKIYVHGLRKEREREMEIAITLESVIACPQLWRRLVCPSRRQQPPYHCLYHLISRGNEKYLYPRLLHNSFSSPIMVAFFSYFPQFPTYQLCMPKVPYTVFLKQQTLLSPDCGLTMFLQHSPSSSVENNPNHSSRPGSTNSQGKPSHLSPGPKEDWIFFWIVKTVFAHFGYILFSEAPQWSR